MPDDPIRQPLAAIAAAQGRSLAWLSTYIGRNTAYLQQYFAYLQQYLKRGSPRVLPEAERRHLAIYFDVDERTLGAREPWRASA